MTSIWRESVQCMMRYSIRQLQGPILWRPNRQMITLWHNFKYKKPLPGLVLAGWNSVMKNTETRWWSAINPSCNQLAIISFHACPEHYSSILLNVFLIFFVMLLTDTCAPITKFHDEDGEHPYIFTSCSLHYARLGNKFNLCLQNIAIK